MITEHRGRFEARTLTKSELAHCRGRAAYAQHVAARFAAKEAVLKALTTGLTGGITWHDIEVRTLPSGQPTLTLSGQAARAAANRNLRHWSISLSHTKHTAIAVAIAWG